jgi:hypothetical protein
MKRWSQWFWLALLAAPVLLTVACAGWLLCDVLVGPDR